ncbi:MAG: hypothetical protein Ct9H90mP9_4810 [Pseudomonadota bacterium]|nr:MAG: hypothetical protein Ct9H90mP9_4810 [Pseudomonadota bacterium]
MPMLNLGLIPNRTLEKTFIGGGGSGSGNKTGYDEVIRGKGKAEASSKKGPGVMMGMVITKKTFSGEAPRSIRFFGGNGRFPSIEKKGYRNECGTERYMGNPDGSIPLPQATKRLFLCDKKRRAKARDDFPASPMER